MWTSFLKAFRCCNSELVLIRWDPCWGRPKALDSCWWNCSGCRLTPAHRGGNILRFSKCNFSFGSLPDCRTAEVVRSTCFHAERQNILDSRKCFIFVWSFCFIKITAHGKTGFKLLVFILSFLCGSIDLIHSTAIFDFEQEWKWGWGIYISSVFCAIILCFLFFFYCSADETAKISFQEMNSRKKKKAYSFLQLLPLKTR